MPSYSWANLNKIPPSKNDENALGNCIITFYLKGFLTSEKWSFKICNLSCAQTSKKWWWMVVEVVVRRRCLLEAVRLAALYWGQKEATVEFFFACKSSSTTFNGANYIRVFYCRSFGRITVMRSAEVSSLECGGYLDSLTRKKSSSKPKYINYIP